MHGPGIDEPILMDSGSAMSCSSTRFLNTDHQGSVIALADCQGNRTAVNAYDEYGIPNAANTGRFQYTGQAWLPELSMYHYKARIYSPTLGRFLQTDPVGYDDQVNLYAYVANDPVNGRDPSGTQTIQDMQLQAQIDDMRQQGMSQPQIDNVIYNQGVMQAKALVGMATVVPMIEAGVMYVGARLGFSAVRGALAAAERGGVAGFRRTAEGAVTSIRNIIRNNGTRGDFLGAARESKGAKTGFDHVTEMKNSVTGLERASGSLGGSLKNPNLSAETRTALEGWKKAADTAIEQMRKMLQ